MNRVEELRFGKQMDKAPDKRLLIKSIIRTKPTRVLDLGAGTGFIAKSVADSQIKVDAVDKCFKVDELVNTEFLTYYPVDIFTFLKHTTNKYDCIILSGLLHELNPFEINKLKRLLKKVINKDNCTIFIREPYYVKEKDVIRPFINKESQKKIKEWMITLTPENKVKEFFRKPKLSGLKVPKPIQYLNLAFTMSYGSQSWEREVKENRFAFSESYLKKFCQSIIPNSELTVSQSYDKNYIKYFGDCGYTEDVINSFDYTNCLIVAQGSISKKSSKQSESEKGE